MKKIDDKTLLNWIDTGEEISLDNLDEETRNRYSLHLNIHKNMKPGTLEQLPKSFSDSVLREFYATPSLMKRPSWKSPHLIFTLVTSVFVIGMLAWSMVSGSKEYSAPYLEMLNPVLDSLNFTSFTGSVQKFHEVFQRGWLLLISFLLILILDAYFLKPLFRAKNI
ncbi:MAG: hypothetical protein AAF363_00835 [Bacteroidota bacterium]